MYGEYCKDIALWFHGHKATANDLGKKAAQCTVTVAHLVEEMQIKKGSAAVETVDLTLGNMTTTITATAKDISGISATCQVVVTQLPILIGISEPAVTLTLGGDASLASAALVATVTPASANDPSVEWTSSDPEVASVDADGNVKGLKEGTGVEALQSMGITVGSANCSIIIDGAAPGTEIRIFDTKGICLNETIVNSSRMIMPMATPDVYIMMISGKSIRIACK